MPSVTAVIDNATKLKLISEAMSKGLTQAETASAAIREYLDKERTECAKSSTEKQATAA